jgi:superfamily II DNA/RNA helicase
MTLMVEQLARRMRIGCVRLHGGVATAQRGALMDRFRDDDATQPFISTDAGGVGLNLQAASALINLDMPWNPAVLEQRIARVHRLGQQRPVQIILVVAADSYEQRITALLQSKRTLFENVVNPEATEDVVGVSKKTLETLLSDLGDERPVPPIESGTVESAGEPVQATEARLTTGAATASEDLTGIKEAALDALVRRTIERIQSTFGQRIERILGVRGGLLVVLDSIDDAAEQTAAALSDAVPVALIEPHTLSGLHRLETFSALRNASELFASCSSAPNERASPHAARAREKLRAAELLIEQKCSSSAIDLLALALISAAAAKADLPQAPAPEEVPLWVCAEAVPSGFLTPEQATRVVRAISLRNTPRFLPP